MSSSSILKSPGGFYVTVVLKRELTERAQRERSQREHTERAQREHLREHIGEQAGRQASKQGSRQALGVHSVGAMPWRGLFLLGIPNGEACVQGS